MATSGISLHKDKIVRPDLHFKELGGLGCSMGNGEKRSLKEVEKADE